MSTGELVCIKIIKNNKDFFDQSLDEIKLLKYINAHAEPDAKNVVQLYGTLVLIPKTRSPQCLLFTFFATKKNSNLFVW